MGVKLTMSGYNSGLKFMYHSKMKPSSMKASSRMVSVHVPFRSLPMKPPNDSSLVYVSAIIACPGGLDPASIV